MEKPNKIDNLPREGDSDEAAHYKGVTDLQFSSICGFMTITVILVNIIHYCAIIPRSENQRFISRHWQA